MKGEGRKEEEGGKRGGREDRWEEGRESVRGWRTRCSSGQGVRVERRRRRVEGKVRMGSACDSSGTPTARASDTLTARSFGTPTARSSSNSPIEVGEQAESAVADERRVVYGCRIDERGEQTRWEGGADANRRGSRRDEAAGRRRGGRRGDRGLGRWLSVVYTSATRSALRRRGLHGVELDALGRAHGGREGRPAPHWRRRHRDLLSTAASIASVLHIIASVARRMPQPGSHMPPLSVRQRCLQHDRGA